MDQNKHRSSSPSDRQKKKDLSYSSPNKPLPVVNDIVTQSGAEQLDFRRLNKHDTLFEGRIADDDEIWMVQTPAEIDADSLRSLSLNFDSSVSKLKFKVNNDRKRFNVYAMSNSLGYVNLLLPSKKTKSFRSRAYPLRGRIILQESTHMTSKALEQKSTKNSGTTV